MIPKLIHFVWLGPPMPSWAERNVAEFRRLNPDHNVIVHGAEDVSDEYRHLCTPKEHPSTRSDLIRYGFLEQVGGWYFDVDYWPLRPVADIEHAYGLDGSQLFAAWMNNPRINNGVLGCGPGLPLWRTLAKWIHAGGVQGRYGGRTKYGPRLVTQLYERFPDQVCIAAWPWFHGVRDVDAGKTYRRLTRDPNPTLLRSLVPETGGQLPFAFHLWAHTHAAQLEGRAGHVVAQAGAGDRLLAVCGQAPRNDTGNRPWRQIAQAAAALGFRAEIVDYHKRDALDQCSDIPEVVVFWNGLKNIHRRHADAVARFGATPLILEHGFFDRNRHFQADHQGILHRASWRERVAGPAPPDGLERLKKFYPSGLRTSARRPNGYVLVLGQVNGDSQLIDSEIVSEKPLQRAIKGVLPDGVRAYFRPHPATAKKRRIRRREILPFLGDGPDPDETETYRKTKTGTGLADALAGAMFAVAINSNALNEALALGVPCLAFGPFLGIDAGVVHPTSLKILRKDLGEMLDGWHPADDAVLNYLAWLAARQWTIEEFGDPALLARLLTDAGVELPERPADSEAAG